MILFWVAIRSSISRNSVAILVCSALDGIPLCKEGDVAFADASEDTNEVAKVIELFNLDNKDIVCGLHTIHGRDKYAHLLVVTV